MIHKVSTRVVHHLLSEQVPPKFHLKVKLPKSIRIIHY